MNQILAVLLFADMANGARDVDVQFLELIDRLLYVVRFSTADDHRCTFQTEPFGDCQSNSDQIDSSLVQFSVLVY